MTNESQWMGAPGWPESVPTPARPEGETPRMIVIGANSAGSILTCSLCGGIVPVLGIDSHRCPTPPARERGEALPWDTTNTVWHLVRIAGIHNGDRESKDVQRAVESVFSRFARLTRELAEARARLAALTHRDQAYNSPAGIPQPIKGYESLPESIGVAVMCFSDEAVRYGLSLEVGDGSSHIAGEFLRGAAKELYDTLEREFDAARALAAAKGGA